MGTELLLFYAFAAVAVLAAVLVVARPNPMHSVLWLIVSFAALAAIYIQLHAPFAAVIQIIIYAGAIMVLFLFVVMLLNARQEETLAPGTASVRGPLRIGAVLAAVLAAELAWALSEAQGSADGLLAGGVGGNPDDLASVRELGLVLFSDYAFAFEVTSILIIVAMVGAVVLAKREL